MNKCPVCGLAMGITLGTCVRCHYNEQKGFQTIEVPVDVLAQYMPFEIISNLLVEHAKKYKEMAVIK